MGVTFNFVIDLNDWLTYSNLYRYLYRQHFDTIFKSLDILATGCCGSTSVPTFHDLSDLCLIKHILAEKRLSLALISTISVLLKKIRRKWNMSNSKWNLIAFTLNNLFYSPRTLEKWNNSSKFIILHYHSYKYRVFLWLLEDFSEFRNKMGHKRYSACEYLGQTLALEVKQWVCCWHCCVISSAYPLYDHGVKAW